MEGEQQIIYCSEFEYYEVNVFFFKKKIITRAHIAAQGNV